MVGFVAHHVESFGPVVAVQVAVSGVDEPSIGRHAFYFFRQLYRTNFANLIDNRSSIDGGGVFLTEFVEVKSVRFPIFMKMQRQIKARQGLQLAKVRLDFVGFLFEIIAVQVESLRVLSDASSHARWVEAGKDVVGDASGQVVLKDELSNSRCGGRFIAMDAP